MRPPSIQFNIDLISENPARSTDYVYDLMFNHNFTFLGKGRHRMTFLAPNRRFVLKFPHCYEGLTANRQEARTFKNHLGKSGRDGIEYAPCRLIKNTILMMVALKEVYGETDADSSARAHLKTNSYDYDKLPSWCHNLDAYQCGRLHNGKLVAYDYAEIDL